MVVLCVLPFRRYSNASIRKSAGRFKFSSISHSLSMRQKSFLFVRSIAFDIWLFFFLFVCLIFTYRVRARSRVHHTYVGWTTVSAFKWWAMHWLNLPLQKNHLFHHSSTDNTWIDFFLFNFFLIFLIISKFLIFLPWTIVHQNKEKIVHRIFWMWWDLYQELQLVEIWKTTMVSNT